jgi:small ligand-binding sensory domain FIST
MNTEADPRKAGWLAAHEAACEVGRERVQTALVFASGHHAREAELVAAGVSDALPNATVVASGGADVMAEERESDGESSLSVLVLTSQVTVHSASSSGAARSIGERLGAQFGPSPGAGFLLFARGHVFDPEAVAGFHSQTQSPHVIGGGTTSGSVLAVKRPGVDAETVSWLAVRFDGGVRLAVGVTPGIVRLTDYLLVERVEEGFVTQLGGRRPLELLSEATGRRADRSLVLVSIAPRGSLHERSNHGLVRGVAGVHPVKGAVHLGPEVEVGDRVAFATPDAHAATEDFRSMVRAVDGALLGGVPLAGLYVGCGSRGSKLFAKPGADARLIRSALGDLPFAGMYSSFEIGPFDGLPRMHVYSGVLGILYSPS